MDKNVVYKSMNITQNKTLPFATTWMDLLGIMLSEKVTQRKTNTIYIYIYAESKKQTLIIFDHFISLTCTSSGLWH